MVQIYYEYTAKFHALQNWGSQPVKWGPIFTHMYSRFPFCQNAYIRFFQFIQNFKLCMCSSQLACSSKLLLQNLDIIFKMVAEIKYFRCYNILYLNRKYLTLSQF